MKGRGSSCWERRGEVAQKGSKKKKGEGESYKRSGQILGACKDEKEEEGNATEEGELGDKKEGEGGGGKTGGKPERGLHVHSARVKQRGGHEPTLALNPDAGPERNEGALGSTR